MPMKRINLNLDEELLSSLDAYAKKMHISRSSACAFILSTYFDGRTSMEVLSDISRVLASRSPSDAGV